MANKKPKAKRPSNALGLKIGRASKNLKKTLSVFQAPVANKLLGAGRHASKFSGVDCLARRVERGELRLHFCKLSMALAAGINLLFTFGKGHSNLLN